jgi:phage terminase large subunit-like protein
MPVKSRKTTSSIEETAIDRVTDYAQRVLSGEYVAGPHVRNACRRHLDDLIHAHDRGFYFDLEEVSRTFAFFETILFLSEGQFEGTPFVLHPSQAFIIGSIYGWKRTSDHFRRFRRAYIEQGKGNGKSPLAGGIGLKGLAGDGEAGAEIYAAGATKEQAGILFRDAVKMRNQSPELAARLTTSGGPGREYNLAYIDKGAFFRPISRETKRTGSGPRPHYALCDEVHEHPDRGVIEMLERGFKFRRQPLLLMITNSGTDRNSIAWEEHEHAIRVAAGSLEPLGPDCAYVGDIVDDTTFSYVCALDKGDDPLTQPECWVKANPLLGITITEEYLAGVVAQAKAMPGKLNNILRLHFCVWTDASTAWMTRELLESCLAEFDPHEHDGKKISIGLDLAQVRDMAAMGCVVETGKVDVEVKDSKTGEIEIVKKPTYDAWIEAWTPKDTMLARETEDKLPYSEWVRQGFLHAPNGSSISYVHVAQTLAEYDHDYDISMVAYDRFAFRRFEEDVQQLGLKIEFVEHPQGGLKKGKATEAMKEAAKAEKRDPEGLWMPGSLRILEEAMLEGRIRLLHNPVLINAMMSAVTDEDKWDNRWLAKQRSVNKIDAAVALCMAMGAAVSIVKKNKEFQLLVF